MKFREIFGLSEKKERRENSGFDKQVIPENPGDTTVVEDVDIEKEIASIEERIKKIVDDPNHSDTDELKTLSKKLDNLRNTAEKGL